MPLSLVTAPAAEPLTAAEARRALLLGSTAGEPAPTAPSIALANPAAPGNCDAGAWRLGFTFVTADGETQLGLLSDPVTVANPAVNGQIVATNVMLGGSYVTARKAYAVPPGGTVARFAGTISDNTTETFTLNIAAANLGADAPTTNTTVDPQITGKIIGARERCEIATQRALITQQWEFLIDEFPREGYIEIPKPPLISIDAIHYVDTSGNLQLWDNPAAPTLYLVQIPAGPRARRGRVALPFAGIWPITQRRIGAVQISFTCGYGATGANVPALLKEAMLLDIGTLYSNREGIVLGGRGASPDELPMGVRAIYFSYRSPSTQRLREGTERMFQSWVG